MAVGYSTRLHCMVTQYYHHDIVMCSRFCSTVHEIEIHCCENYSLRISYGDSVSHGEKEISGSKEEIIC